MSLAKDNAELPFLKMNGLGNDFVVIDGRATDFKPSINFLRAIANRKRGIGCDQVVILRKPKSARADVYLEMYNADATPISTCGNATRCISSLLFEELGAPTCTIETAAGLLQSWAEKEGQIAVDFGEPHLLWQDIPLSHEMDTLNIPLSLGDLHAPCCVNVGNPHAVFFVNDAEAIPLNILGPELERHPLFPEKCNIEVAQILGQDRIRMRVWERGTGITEACGSGSCATLVAAVRRGLCARRATILLDGGELTIEWRKDNHVVMTGSASYNFSGMVAKTIGDIDLT